MQKIVFIASKLFPKKLLYLKTEFKIEFLLPGTGSRKVLKIILDITNIPKHRTCFSFFILVAVLEK